MRINVNLFNFDLTQIIFAAADAEKAGLGATIKGAFIWLLETLYQFTAAIGFPNWILTIFLFTLIVRLAIQPLMSKQMRSTRKMQMLAPEVEEIKKRYASNPQKMNAETMRLYKENDASPTAGCLPLLVQMPILILLFNAIRTYTPADPQMMANFTFPLLGIDNLSMFSNALPGINGWVLPVLSGAATFVQSWTSTANHKDKTQRMMLIMMPLMFLWFVRQFPALMAFYWIFYSLISAAIFFPLMKRWEKMDKEKIEAARKAREEEAEKKRMKKNAAREAAAAKRKQQQQKKASYTVEEGDFEPDEEELDLDDDDEEENPEKAFQLWLVRKGITVKKKKMRLHPYSPADELVELGIWPNGREVTLASLRSEFDKEKMLELQKAQLESTGLGKLLTFGRKKKKDEPTDQDAGE